MKKTLIACAIAVGASVAAVGAQAADGGGRSGGHGGGSWSGSHGNWSGGQGNWSGNRGNWNGGRNWNRSWHGTNWRGHGSRFFGSVFLGWPWYTWGPSYYYDYPAYSYYGAPAYYDSTQIYVEPPAGSSAVPSSPQAQYYCPDSGYYPAVQACPRGWLRVLPDGAPPR